MLQSESIKDEVKMGKVIFGVTISLDGFAEDRDVSVGAMYPEPGRARQF